MNVIKKLRRRFILLATLAVFIIIAGALSLINFMGWHAVRERCMDTLSYIAENNGTLPSQLPQDSETNFWEFPFLSGSNPLSDTPEYPHLIRYFSIRLDRNGLPVWVNAKNISAFSDEQAFTFARTAYLLSSDSGFLYRGKVHYAYLKTHYEDGSTLICILDCTREFADVHTFLSYSVWFGLLCLILYVIIFAVLSNRAIAPFVRNMESQKRFITNASHELKTPLSIISVNAEAMEMLNGKTQFSEAILKQVTRLNKLVNDLILLSKAEEIARQQLSSALFPLSSVMKEVAEEFRPLIEENGKHLTLSCPEDIQVKNDQKYLASLLHILMDNAAKYCDEGGTVSLSACQGRKKDTVFLSVTNSYAEGKDADYTKFFERFYRKDESHNSKKSGYGIGLSIAQELSALLQTPLKVSYAEGNISFTLRLRTR